MKWLARLVGTVGAVGGLLYGAFLLFKNPYINGPPATDVLINFILLFFVPLLLAIYASLALKPKLLMISMFWSLPICLYLLGTPGLFKWLIVAPLLLFVAGMMLLKDQKAGPAF